MNKEAKKLAKLCFSDMEKSNGVIMVIPSEIETFYNAAFNAGVEAAVIDCDYEKVTKERDELKDLWGEMLERYASYKEQLAAMTKERDELMEALEKIAEVCNGYDLEAGWACKHARAALAKVGVEKTGEE